jgi:amino acid transporter
MSDEPVTADSAAPPHDDEVVLNDLGFKQELHRVLGFVSSFCFQFTIVAVAAGLVLVFATGFSNVGGLLLPAWIVGGALQFVVALGVCVAVSAFPLAGGPYQIVSILGFPRTGWLMGYILALGLIAAIASEAVGLVPFYASWAGFTLTSHVAIFIAAAVLILIGTLLNLAGVKVAAFVNNGAVFAEGVAILILVIGLGIAWVVGDKPFQGLGFLTHSSGIIPSGSPTNVIVIAAFNAILVPVFVICQFYANGTAGEETKHAGKIVPKALWTSALVSLIVGIVILFMALLAVTNVGDTVASSSPLTYILRERIGALPAKTFEVLAVLALTVNMMLMQLTAARIIWAYARNKSIPASTPFSRLTKSGVPLNATWVVAIVALVFCGWSSLLNVLVATAAVLSALPMGVLTWVTWRARRNGTLPPRFFDLGKWTAPVMTVATLWSFVLCGIMIYIDPSTIGTGVAVSILVGVVLMVLVNRRFPIVHPTAKVSAPSLAVADEASGS